MSDRWGGHSAPNRMGQVLDTRRPAGPRIARLLVGVGLVLRVIPQIVAIAVMLSKYEHADTCNSESHIVWVKLMLARLCIECVTAVLVWKYAYEPFHPIFRSLEQFNNLMGLLLTVLIIYGLAKLNEWKSCAGKMYDLNLALIIVYFAGICMPCIMLVVLLPFWLLCPSCLLDFFAPRDEREYAMGVTNNQINNLPEVNYDPNSSQGSNTACAICYVDYEPNEKLVKLQCSHQYHKYVVYRLQ